MGHAAMTGRTALLLPFETSAKISTEVLEK
jgi:hypothetical protein